MNRQSHRHQRTIARAVEVRGVGFLTGATIRLCFRPAPPSTGVVFVRTDLGPDACLPAHFAQVTGTQRRTTLGRPPLQVSLVEHVLAALAGLRVDNCLVELDGPEPPGLDGSSREFVAALREAEPVVQAAKRPVWHAEAPVLVRQNGATLSLQPTDQDRLRVTYVLDYGLNSPICRQAHTVDVTPETFANEIARCRTFLLEEEARELRRQGLGSRTKTSDLLVFGPRGPIDNRLRYANEPARHKILDLVGDLSLLGQDVRGHLVAYRSGHPLNVELVRALARRLIPREALSFRQAA